MIIFDIGGNKGLFTDKCLNTYPECTIIIVEPNPILFDSLKHKYKNKNVIVLDFLVSSKNDELVEFFISDVDTISTASLDWVKNSRFSKNSKWNKKELKKTINLDELVKIYGKPNLVKIDVEGYEYEVMLGLTQKLNDICFEWAEEQYENINKTCLHLKSLGYENFGCIYNDDYLNKPNTFSSWIDCDIHNNISSNRKMNWGMIWVN